MIDTPFKDARWLWIVQEQRDERDRRVRMRKIFELDRDIQALKVAHEDLSDPKNIRRRMAEYRLPQGAYGAEKRECEYESFHVDYTLLPTSRSASEER